MRACTEYALDIFLVASRIPLQGWSICVRMESAQLLDLPMSFHRVAHSHMARRGKEDPAKDLQPKDTRHRYVPCWIFCRLHDISMWLPELSRLD